ncbi:GGDEF domain-containing protein [Alteromonas flava]|uniref:GGDEF domain-containing protein n=1 Tax=Alteromonas flava TaxID=2048003 RepID=UPI0013DCEA88|nr:GGDEF domain-containing protein [Alteromonas flava]
MILSAVLACTFIFIRISKTFLYTTSLKFFKFYFLFGTVGFFATWLAVEGVVPTLLGGSVVAFCVSCAMLYLAVINHYSDGLLHVKRVIILAIVFSLTAVNISTIPVFALVEAFFALTLLPYATFTMVRQGQFKRNCGTALVMAAILIVQCVAVFQIVWVMTSDDVKQLFAVTVFSQAVSFVFIGLGVTTGLLINEKKKVTELSNKDPLTGLSNRRGMEMQVNLGFAEGTTLTAIAIDIDFFKKINDSYGHEAGDLVLSKVSELLTSLVRDSDICCRLGGEEFIVLVAGNTITDTLELSERLRAAIEGFGVEYQGKNIHFTSSFGVAECQENETIPELIKRADVALYQAKSAGRNRVVLAT